MLNRSQKVDTNRDMHFRCTGVRSFMGSLLYPINVISMDTFHYFGFTCIGIDSCKNVTILNDYNLTDGYAGIVV